MKIRSYAFKDFGCIWRCMIIFIIWKFNLQVKDPFILLHRKLGGLQNNYGWWGDKDQCPC
jgi:hypothetical protein